MEEGVGVNNYSVCAHLMLFDFPKDIKRNKIRARQVLFRLGHDSLACRSKKCVFCVQFYK